jgi:transposase InsO family protein
MQLWGGLIWVENQVSLGANETVMGKARFEQWLYDQCICEVKHYHGDNGIFSAEEFRHDCEEKRQSQSFSGFGAQHQNARAERAIQTIMYMARTFMVLSNDTCREQGAPPHFSSAMTPTHKVMKR